MPRNVRNFWLDGEIDGRKERLEGGPVSKEGGFSLQVKMREEGDISIPVTLRGWASREGNRLFLEIQIAGQIEPVRIETIR